MPSQTFTSSGSWTFPSNYLSGSLICQAWGEGGNGDTPPQTHNGGGGGGGGEFAQDTPDGTAGSTVLTITIGTGGSGTSTTVTGGSISVTAHAGGNASATVHGNGGSGSTNATHNNGGDGGDGRQLGSSGNGGGGGGGGSAGSGGTGGVGGTGTSGSGGSGGTAGTGTAGGSVGGTGGLASAGSNGNAPGSGGGGGGSSSLTNFAGGTGAAGQVILTWSTLLPFAPVPPRIRYAQLPAAILTPRKRQNADFVPAALPVFVKDTPRYPESARATLIRRDRGQAPAGLPVPVQPPEIPHSVRRWSPPPWPRRGHTITQFPTQNIPPTESYRARFKPPWPRRGVVTPTGWPVPVQPPKSSSSVRMNRYRYVRPISGTSNWPFTAAALVQPPWSSWSYKRRWTRPLLPRKGVVPPEALPPPPVVTFLNPISQRRIQRYQWFRRGSVPSTGWPISVQPPMTSQELRRWYKPPYPRRGVVPVNALPAYPPVPGSLRREQKYQWFRKGNAQPDSGLPVPVQPPELSHAVRREPLRQLLPRRRSPSFSAFVMPVQPPERMQAIRRWSIPPWPRRGRTDIATLPGVQLVAGYQQLSIQTFTYTPGGPGLDLLASLTLLPLNKLGFSFWNQYGDVLFIVYNNTPLAVNLTPVVIRTIELQTVELPAYTLAPGAVQAFGPFPYGDFANPNLIDPANEYLMAINAETSQSGLSAGAFRMVPAPPTGHTGRYDLLGARLRNAIKHFFPHLSSTPGEIHPGESTPGA